MENAARAGFGLHHELGIRLIRRGAPSLGEANFVNFLQLLQHAFQLGRIEIHGAFRIVLHDVEIHKRFQEIRVVKFPVHKAHPGIILRQVAFPVDPGVQHFAERLGQRAVRPEHFPVSFVDAIFPNAQFMRPGHEGSAFVQEHLRDGLVHFRQGSGQRLRSIQRRGVALALELGEIVIGLHDEDIDGSILRGYVAREVIRGEWIGKFQRRFWMGGFVEMQGIYGYAAR